ncbi:class I SAM-dependent RNA methyltransferase [Nannocystaceae bacterium ST9]
MTIRDLAHGGEGVGRSEDPEETRVWFVEGALPGERVRVALDHEHKRWLRGHVTEVIEKSEQRVEPPCPLASRCGGCSWQHVAAPAQAELKRGIVASQLRKLAVEVGSVHASPESLGYRRRARLHYRKTGPQTLELGFFGHHTHDIVDHPSCPVLSPVLDWGLQRLREWVEFLPADGEVLGLCNEHEVVLGLPGVRHTPEFEAAIRATIEHSEAGEGPSLAGVQLRGGREHVGVGRTALELDGKDKLAPVVQGPFTFSQAQRAQNEALVEHVLRMARVADTRVLELHAGVGNFARALAREAKRVWTVDGDREAVTFLQRLVERERLPIAAKRGKVERLLANLAENGERRYDVVVLDPPRAGIGEESARHLAQVAQQRIVYVSCDPATLARDLAVLVEHGFAITDVTVFDMMPMTAEVETVTTLVRKPGGGGGRRK